ncbi:MAG: hypothetical protein A2Y15_02620 [Clostridiales bacterium GWF2_36_10]|nr:MAG: hypothetical protein A2Y15_02620 [Clostridiales bacterium GWF2_36_10]
MKENEILKAIQQLDTKFEKRFDTVDNKIGTLQQDVSSVKTDLSTLKQDMSSVKANVSTLQQDVSSVKTDASTLQQDMSSVKTDVSTLQQDMSSVKTDVSTLQQDVSKTNIEFEEFRGVLGDVLQLEKENRREIKKINSNIIEIKNNLFLHEVAIKKAI